MNKKLFFSEISEINKSAYDRITAFNHQSLLVMNTNEVKNQPAAEGEYG